MKFYEGRHKMTKQTFPTKCHRKNNQMDFETNGNEEYCLTPQSDEVKDITFFRATEP